MAIGPKPTYQDLFESGLSKSERTRIEIARAAITCYSTIGAEQTNFDRVAKTAGVTRPLIQHYFKTREALFTFVVKYIRSHAEVYARERLKPGKSGAHEFRLSLEICLDWVQKHPSHAKVWLLFQYYASVDEELRELNSSMTNELHQALAMVLMKVYGRDAVDFAALVGTAKLIQQLLSGALLSRVTENRPMPEAEFRKQIIRRCVELAES